MCTWQGGGMGIEFENLGERQLELNSGKMSEKTVLFTFDSIILYMTCKAAQSIINADQVFREKPEDWRVIETDYEAYNSTFADTNQAAFCGNFRHYKHCYIHSECK